MPFIELQETEVKSKGRNGVFQAARAAVRFGAKDTVCLEAWSKRAPAGREGEAPVMLYLSLDDADKVGRTLVDVAGVSLLDWWTVITMDDATGNMVAVMVQERDHDAAMASVSLAIRKSDDRDEHGTLVVGAIKGKVPVMPPCESGATAYAVDLAGEDCTCADDRLTEPVFTPDMDTDRFTPEQANDWACEKGVGAAEQARRQAIVDAKYY